MLKAIFFDLGSTLWDDYPTELHQWQVLVDLLAKRGINTSLDEVIATAHEVIRTFSPSLTRSIAWRYLDGDEQAYWEVMNQLVDMVTGSFDDPEEFTRLNPLFPGIHDLLKNLSQRFPLAIVTQHFSSVERWMGYHGIAGYFKHLSISGRERIFKPDPRLFLSTCKALDVAPEHVMMVGDRLDNDIWPANRLKMTTVRVLADPYRVQQPRYHTDVPDYEIAETSQLLGVIDQLS